MPTMPGTTWPGIESLLRTACDPQKILQVAAARALVQLTGPLAPQLLSTCRTDAADFLRNEAVTGPVWMPEQHQAMDLVREKPHRETLLNRVIRTETDPRILYFVHLAGPQFDREHNTFDRQLAGDEVTKIIAALGDEWKPEIVALFRIYLSLFDKAMEERMYWMANPAASGRGFPGYAGALSVNWQLTWAAARAPMAEVLRQIAPYLGTASTKVRWAGAQFIEEAAQFQHVAYAPLFGVWRDLGYRYQLNQQLSYQRVFDSLLYRSWLPPVAPPVRPLMPPGAPSVETSQPKPPPPAQPAIAVVAPDPNARYADIQFLRDKNQKPGEPLPDTTTLKAGLFYWLEVAVRRTTVGVKQEGPEKPIRKVKQEKAIEVLVTADSDEFEIKAKVAPITLPPTGDSTRNALFRVRAPELAKLSAGAAGITVRCFYRFNLLEYVNVTATIGSAEVSGTIPAQRKRQLSRGVFGFRRHEAAQNEHPHHARRRDLSTGIYLGRRWRIGHHHACTEQSDA